MNSGTINTIILINKRVLKHIFNAQDQLHCQCEPGQQWQHVTAPVMSSGSRYQ